MTDKVVVFVSCENSDQARKIAETLVHEKLAACVNITAPVQSCYMWEGKLTWSDEVLAIIKTTRGRFSQLESRIQSIHSYEVPEIVSIEIDAGSEKYLSWVDRSVGG